MLNTYYIETIIQHYYEEQRTKHRPQRCVVNIFVVVSQSFPHRYTRSMLAKYLENLPKCFSMRTLLASDV